MGAWSGVSEPFTLIRQAAALKGMDVDSVTFVYFLLSHAAERVYALGSVCLPQVWWDRT